MRSHHQPWRIFHLFRMRCYRLVNHPPPASSPRPSQLFSLSLDMSLQQRLRNPLSLSLSPSALLWTHVPGSTHYLLLIETCFSTKQYPSKISISANLCLPNRHLSGSRSPNRFIFVCSAHLQVEFRWNCVLMKTNLALFVAPPACIGPIRRVWRRRVETGKRIRIF